MNRSDSTLLWLAFLFLAWQGCNFEAATSRRLDQIEADIQTYCQQVDNEAVPTKPIDR